MGPSGWSRFGAARRSRYFAGVQMACRIVLIAASLVSSLFAASGSAVAQTFSYTGGEQSYLVPAGVTTLHVVVVGAPGGQEPGVTSLPAGLGAVVSADLPIPLGQTVLYVEVGGAAAFGSA